MRNGKITATTFTIPIKPHLKKFLLHGKRRQQEPLKVTERSTLGVCIMKILAEKRNWKFEKVLEDYTERITIIPGKEMLERSPRLHRLVYINVDLEKVFKECLYVWVAAQSKAGVPEYEACKNFIDHYSIRQNEYTYDAAERAWRRYKNGEYNMEEDSTQELS